MIKLKTASIKAACGIAATKDIRYYLIGIQILVRDDGSVHVRSTSGSAAFDDLMPDKSAYAPADFIIPLDVAKTIAKSKSEFVEITMSADGRYECAGQIFAPIDGKFPDVDRVMPARDTTFDTAVNHYDAELLSKCQTAMRIATGSSSAFYRVQNSPCGLMFRETCDYPRCALAPLSDIAFGGN